MAPAFQSQSTNVEPSLRANPWETCLEYAKTHVDEETAVWKDEVEKLLIFAGLFSGVVASFTIEAYHNVQDNPTETTALVLQALLALQLNATNPQPQTITPVNPDFHPAISTASKRIMVYQSLSLLLSVSAAMAGILCLQWIREYARIPNGVAGSRREHLGIHLMRRESLERWQVMTVLSLLPLLLLLSLLLFFIGFIELLFDIGSTSAAASSLALVGVVSGFFLATTLLPGLLPYTKFSQCPYKSPQSWVFYQLVQSLRHFSEYAMSRWAGGAPELREKVAKFWSWSDYDAIAYRNLKDANVGRALHWLGEIYLQYTKFSTALYQCIQDKSIQDLLWLILVEEDKPRPMINQQTGGTKEDRQALEDAHLQDLTTFQTLENMVGQIEQGEPSGTLIQERLELFLKINRSVAPGDELDCPLIGSSNTLISQNTHSLVLKGIGQILDKNPRYNETYLKALRDIVHLESQMLHPNIPTFEKAEAVLKIWIVRLRELQQTIAPGAEVEQSAKALSRIDALRRQTHLLMRFAQAKGQDGGD